MGNTGATGPAGPAGPTGNTGAPGPTGPKGSFLQTKFGVREIACMEAAVVLAVDFLPRGHRLDPIYEDMVLPKTISRIQTDNYDLIVGIRKDFAGFRLPASNEAQRQHSIRFWKQEYLPKAQRQPMMMGAIS